MSKEDIIKLAESMGFILDYDKFDDKGYPIGSSKFRYLRFISNDKSLDELALRWIWYRDIPDEDNISNGEFTKARLIRKKEIQEFLKY